MTERDITRDGGETRALKPLAWRKPTDFDRDLGHESSDLMAPGIGGNYSIQSDLDNFILWRIEDPFAFDTYPTMAAAKAAAEAHWQEQAAKIIAARGADRQRVRDDLAYLLANERGHAQATIIESAIAYLDAPSVVGASEPVGYADDTMIERLAKGRETGVSMVVYPRSSGTYRTPLYTAQPLEAENRSLREALERIATVDMGGGFLGAMACRQVASQALSQESDK